MKRILSLLLGVLLIAVFAASGTGLWFGGSYSERDKWQGRYEALDSESKGLRREYDQARSDYDGIREAVNLRLGHIDRKAFITPRDASIAAEVVDVAGSLSVDADEMWADYYRLYDWVVANVTPSRDSSLPILPDLPCNFQPELMLWKPDYWRMPRETLADRAGDCEDMATLLASMIMNYTEGKYDCWVVTWSSEEGFGHAAVAVPCTGGNLAILDPAGKYKTGPERYRSVSSAVDEWLGNSSSVSGVHVSGVFSNTDGRVFASTDEFLEWAGTRTR